MSQKHERATREDDAPATMWGPASLADVSDHASGHMTSLARGRIDYLHKPPFANNSALRAVTP
jgi:hypothetical protein